MNDRLKSGDGAALARRALDMMTERAIAPSPENYETWLTYLLGDNPDLNAEIDALEAEGAPFTEDVCLRLHDAHFIHRRLEDTLLTTGASMSNELEAVQIQLEEAGRNTADYGRALEGASFNFTGADPDRLQSLVGVLMEATQKMRRHTESLETKLRATSHEVRNLRCNLEHVREQAMTDALTGIANRKRLDELLDQAAARAAQEGLPLSVAIADIDHFKGFNDTWGHQTGDQIIRLVAQTLDRTAGEEGEVGRYGGEEFVVVMLGADLARGRQILETARVTVEGKRLLRRSTSEDLGTVTFSAGIAQLRPGESAHALVARADALLYQSKRGGRNRVTGDDEAAAQAQGQAA